MLPEALTTVLRLERSGFNARFAAARRRWTHLDATDFSLFLRDQLAPLVTATPLESSAAVARVGYDLGLQLVAEKLAGPAAVDPTLNLLWRETLPTLAPSLCSAPRRTLGSLCNAAHRLAVTPGADGVRWRGQLGALGPRCGNADQLLALGRLLAWRCGLAAYRLPALEASSSLPESLAVAALDAPTGSSWPELAAAYRDQPWFGFARASASVRDERMRRVGTFRGFGGLFVEPPTVETLESELLVRCGQDAWVLRADVFGATFHRLPAATAKGSRATELAGMTAPVGHRVTSMATSASTVAFTTAQSHAVWVGPRLTA